MPDENLEDEVKTDAAESEAPAEETTADEEKETPAPPSGEDKPTEDSKEQPAEADGQEAEEAKESTDAETDAEEEPVKIAPKPVEGETPRERALRLEVERVKGLNRELRGKKLLGDAQPASALGGQTELSAEDKKALEVFDPEQVGNMEKLLPVLAKKLGFVKRDDLSKDTYQSASQDTLDTWLEQHPDYLPENDKGDILFNRLKEEIGLYQKPTSPKGWTKILNRAHNEIMGITTQSKVSVPQVQAQQEKIKVASHGPASGGPKKGEQMRKTSATPDVKAAMASGALKGFDESDFQ